jgi:hypothetical protein
MSDFERFRAVSTIVWFATGHKEDAFVLSGDSLLRYMKISMREYLNWKMFQRMNPVF